jgi:hypothetical protein
MVYLSLYFSPSSQVIDKHTAHVQKAIYWMKSFKASYARYLLPCLTK